MDLTEIQIPGQGYNLAATLVTPSQKPENVPAVVFYHGMVSQRKPRMVPRAQKVAEKGFIALTFDFRGCGESSGTLGELSLADWLTDALLAYDFLKNYQGVEKERIGICGKSFGGYMAALVTAQRPVKSMVLQAPAVYPDGWFNVPYVYYKGDGENERLQYRLSKDALVNKGIEAIKRYKNPLFVVGSENDTLCPKQVVEGYYNQSGAKKKMIHWIKGADHPLTQPQWDGEYTTLMADWFEQTL